MKKNKMMRIASVLLVAVLLSTCAISGTFAKYVTTFEGEDTATVAKWEIQVSDIKQDEVATKTFTFNILETITDVAGSDDGESTDDDVLADRLAPGTKGSFTIDVKNTSDVVATYSASLGGIDGLPIKFTVKNPTGELAMTSGAETITVEWEWPFESGSDASEIAVSDEADMDLAGEEITVTATVTVTQKN